MMKSKKGCGHATAPPLDPPLSKAVLFHAVPLQKHTKLASDISSVFVHDVISLIPNNLLGRSRLVVGIYV